MTTKNSHVLFWNIWGHRHPKELHTFLQSCVPATDVFCLTEVTDVNHKVIWETGTALKYGGNPKENPQHVNGHQQLQNELNAEYHSLYGSSRRSTWKCELNGHLFTQVGFGSALFYRRELKVIATGESLLCENIDNIRPRLVQWIVYEKANVRYLLAHFHGIWIADNTKGEDPARQQQSVEFLSLIEIISRKYLVDKIVFGGDFNLDIKTASLALLKDMEKQQVGPFRNLIEEFGCKDTRTTSYRKHGWPGESMYADYTFVSPNVSVQRFDVLNGVTASDHAPLLVEYL